MSDNVEFSTPLFMEEVQMYECLYNKFNKQYRNKFVRLNCWRKIAKFPIYSHDINLPYDIPEEKFPVVKTKLLYQSVVHSKLFSLLKYPPHPESMPPCLFPSTPPL